MKIVGVKVMVQTCDGLREVLVPLEEFAKLFTPTIERFKEDGAWGERSVLRVLPTGSAERDPK